MGAGASGAMPVHEGTIGGNFGCLLAIVGLGIYIPRFRNVKNETKKISQCAATVIKAVVMPVKAGSRGCT